MSPAPRYPVYVISKGRAEERGCLTPGFLADDGVEFRLVVEPQEADAYRARFPDATIEVLPFSNLGLGGIPARNYVWEHALASGAERHWILDDNIEGIWRWNAGRRLHCASGPALAAMEDFVDRYENVGIAGPNYVMFAIGPAAPYRLNRHVYSCLLIRNDLPYRWRGRYNEDTDLCLQVLSGGLTTVQFQAFLIQKLGTMTTKGGNTDELYDGDGRLRMARALERVWPGIVRVDRRFQRPQHVVDWSKFDTPLIRREDVDFDALAAAGDPYPMRLVDRKR